MADEPKPLAYSSQRSSEHIGLDRADHRHRKKIYSFPVAYSKCLG